MSATVRVDERHPAPPPAPSPADRLRAARLAAGLSQFRLAQLAGVSLNTIGISERGARITRATAEKLSGVLGLDAAELLR